MAQRVRRMCEGKVEHLFVDSDATKNGNWLSLGCILFLLFSCKASSKSERLVKC